jgi:PAS domain S-box-containing protein
MAQGKAAHAGKSSPSTTVLIIDRCAPHPHPWQQWLGQGRCNGCRVLRESYDAPLLELCQSQAVNGILLASYFPDTTGLELIAWLRDQLADHCPPIIAVDQNDAQVAMRAIKAGAADYLCREQLTAEQLEQVLGDILARCPTRPSPATYPQAGDRDQFLAVGSDLQAIAGQDGYFHWVSPTFEQVLGWTATEMIARPWVEFIHPEDVSASRQTSEQLMAGVATVAFENRYRCKDGSYRWLLWRCRLDDVQQVSYGTAVDITALKQSQAALDQSRDELVQRSQTFDAILSTISDFIYLFDREGRFVFVNQPLLDLWGLTLGDVVGKTFFDLHYPEATAAKLQRQVGQVFETQQPLKDELQYFLPNGNQGIYEYILTPLVAADGVVQSVVGSTRDITERKQTEAALQISEERFRLTANTIPEIIWITDAKGRIEFVNQQWRAYTGSSQLPETAIEAMVSFVHPDDVAVTLASFHQALQGGGLFRAEHRIRSAEGQYRWFLIQAEPYCHGPSSEIDQWFGTLVDIHDRKLAEAALSASEVKYRSLFNSMDEGFCILQVLFEQQQPLDYRYIEINPAFEQQTGLKNALGQTMRQLVPDIESFWVEIYGRVALTGQSMRFEDYSKSMGRWFDVNAFRIGNPKDRQVAVLFKDITDRKQLLAREKEAREQAERANRTKDEFLAILSHELRSPLNPILGWSKLLQTRTFDAEKTHQALATIERNAQLQTQLIDDLLDVAKILRGKLELKTATIDLATVVEAALDVVHTAVQAKALTVHLDLASDCRVCGDGARLQQVIWNLLTNAVKFTPRGGQIDVRLEATHGCTQLTITDTGKGISPEFLPQLFDSFRQEDLSITRHYGGLGLGLSIVKYLVEAHGGCVFADSPGPGQGATFTLQFPLSMEVAGQPCLGTTTLASACDPLNLTGAKVLAVDDSPDSRDLMVTLLEHHGAQVKAAASGRDALTDLQRFQPTVLVCDIGMPDMDGYTLLQHIRRLPPERGGQVPAIAVTAYAQTDDRQRALACGFQGHIAKPIEPHRLLDAIAALVHQSSSGASTDG